MNYRLHPFHEACKLTVSSFSRAATFLAQEVHLGRRLSPHRSVISVALVLLLAFGWATSPGASAVNAGPSTVGVSSVAGAVAANARESLSRQVTQDVRSCVAPVSLITPTPSATPTASPIASPTSTPIPTPTAITGNPSPTATVVPGAEPLPPLPADCIVSASPPEAFNALGRPHQVYFQCGNTAALLPGPATNPYPFTGCFDVAVSAVDVTNGASISLTALRCGGVAVTQQQGTDCSTAQNPICPAGYSPTGPGSSCSQCPTGFTYRPGDNLCHFNPAGGTCPPGSTTVTTSTGAAADCTRPRQSLVPQQQNVVVATINPGAPHDYMITFTGFVGTTSAGACPQGTTPVPDVNLTGTAPGSPPFRGPACRFTLSVQKKYIEGTSLKIVPIGPCGDYVPPDITGTFGGTPCFFEVKATGTVVLKENVVCGNGTEPVTGTDATPAGFALGSTYSCADNSLKVVNVPVPFVPIDLSATNGIFNPTCIPQSRKPVATATPVNTSTGPPTTTPVPTNTPSATSTPTPSPTPIGGTATPQPGTSGPTFCGPPGSPTTTVVTDQNGIAGAVGTKVFYRANAVPQFPPQRSFETIIGQFLLDGAGVPNVHMLAAFNFPNGTEFCDSGFTNTAGIATCSKYVDDVQPDVPINVAVNFVFNCSEFDTSTNFTIVQLNTPTPTPGVNGAPVAPLLVAPAPNGICIVRTGPGPLTVTATFTSTVNTQPSLSTGPVSLGTFGVDTPTPAPTNTPIVVPSTPGTPGTGTPTTATVTTPKASPSTTTAPTSTPTPTATPTRVPPTATPRPTAVVHTLRFSLDAARTSKVRAKANKQGLNSVRLGQKVWLMMYFTTKDLPKKLTRVTTYDVRDMRGRSVFKVAFKGDIGPAPKDLGATVRYTTYLVPRNLAFGVYQFRATLKIGSVSRTRQWRFAVVRSPYVATSGAQQGLRDHEAAILQS
ncbi:MAG: hypothetical protein NVS4B2_00800 [Chloroflexota bacterium]